MDKKPNCKNCLDYINGYDGKKMCSTDIKKLVKVSFPGSPPCIGSKFRGMINLYMHKCIDCDHHKNDGGVHYCMAVLDLVDGEPKTCEEARNKECQIAGKYYVGK